MNDTGRESYHRARLTPQTDERRGRGRVALHVAVFHQDELFADGLSAVLEALNFQVTSVRSLEEAVQTASSSDVVIVDMRADGALAAVQELSNRSSGLRVLGCIEAGDPRPVTALMRAGAAGWISTADGVDRLVQLLRRPVGSVPAGTTVERAGRRTPATTRERYRLTAREMEVVRALARGASTEALASTLHVSPATARTHVHNVLAKLGVHTRLEAVAYAIEHQLVHVDELADSEGETERKKWSSDMN